MRPVLWMGAALLYAVSAAAQQVPANLTLADAVRLADERNPDLDAARRAVDAARADRTTAKAFLNPAFTFESEGTSIFRSPPNDGHEVTARVDQDLLIGSRRQLQVQSADSGVTAAEARLTDARRLLLFRVREAYLDAVLAKADQEVARTSLDEIDRVIGLNRARFQQGAISGVEFRRLQVERLRFADDAFAAELALRNAKSTLLALLNMPALDQPFDLAESLVPAVGGVAALTVPIDRTAAGALASANRPDLAAAREDVARATTETRLQRALRTPSPTVGAGYKHNGGNDTFLFGVTVPLPLFNRNNGPIARAEAERQAAESRAQAARLTVNLDVQRALNVVDVSRARAQYIEGEALKNAQETRDIMLASYRTGAITLIDYLDAQRAFRDTVRSYNRAAFEYRLSLFQLEAATGAPPIRQ